LRRKLRGIILHTQETFVKEARRLRLEDGHLSAADAGQALKLTVQMATKDLGPKGLLALANITGKGTEALTEVIHEELGAMKLIPKVSEKPQG